MCEWTECADASDSADRAAGGTDHTDRADKSEQHHLLMRWFFFMFMSFMWKLMVSSRLARDMLRVASVTRLSNDQSVSKISMSM